MQLVLKFRNMLPTVVREELDSLVAIIMGFWHVEHNADGSHGDIHVDSITVGGVPIIPGQGGGTATLPTTTKGDLIAHDGTQNVRVPVGSIGRVLSADPSAAPGVSWQIPAAGNVAGPASAVVDHVATYADTTGKTLKDSGIAASNLPLLDAPINRFLGELELFGPAAGDIATRLTLTDNTQIGSQRDWQMFNGSTLLAIVALNDTGFQAEFDFQRDGTFSAPKLLTHDLTTTPLNPASLNAPVPITKGGTGQATKQAAFDALSPATTKGDLILYGPTGVRLPVGANGSVLTADASAAPGVSWQSPFAGATWTPIPYNAANFGGSGAMTWTVEAGDQTTLQYLRIGSLIMLAVQLGTTSIGGTVNTNLTIALPFTPVFGMTSVGRLSVGSVYTVVWMIALAGTPTLYIQKQDLSNFALGTNNTSIVGSVVIGV